MAAVSYGSMGVRWQVRRFEELDSTNRWLLDEARAGAPAGLVAVADHQTAGRGRRGRAWEAAPGSSLLVSVLVRPKLDVERLHVLTMAVALALADAVRDVSGVRADVKWPNDLVVGDRKLAGLLAEADVSATGEVRAVVIGAGCNIEPDAMPDELAATATAIRREVDVPVDRWQLLDALLDGLGTRLDALDAVGADYRERLATLGQARPGGPRAHDDRRDRRRRRRGRPARRRGRPRGERHRHGRRRRAPPSRLMGPV